LEGEGSTVSGETGTEAAAEKEKGKASKKSKAQLWNEMKISCKLFNPSLSYPY
jgi:hypothetical protein